MASEKPSMSTILAYGVREPFRKRHANVMSFMHSMKPHVHDLLDTWIAEQKSPVPPSHLYSGDYIGIDGNFESTIESEM